MFQIFSSGLWELEWCHIDGAWAALVPKLDSNGAKEAGRDAGVSNEPHFGTVFPDSSKLNYNNIQINIDAASAKQSFRPTPNCLTSKTAGRNINHLRYADNTTRMAESEELKSLLKVKEERQKVGLKLNIQKT